MNISSLRNPKSHQNFASTRVLGALVHATNQPELLTVFIDAMVKAHAIEQKLIKLDAELEQSKSEGERKMCGPHVIAGQRLTDADLRGVPLIGLNAYEKQLVVKGEKVQAIREVRIRLQCELPPAKEAVEAYQEEISKPNEEELRFLRATPCNKLGAIKSYRERTGLGLKESKDFMDRAKY